MIYNVFLCENSLRGEERKQKQTKKNKKQKKKTGGQGAKKFYMKASSVMLTLSYIELVHIQQNNYD